MIIIKRFNKDIGFYGEDLALSYLESNGYHILDKNFKTKTGEIDLICSYKGLIIFIEVKSRYSTLYGKPLEAVTYSKQKQIINLSKLYILKKKLFDHNFRFDVIEVNFKNDDSFSINHIEDAFRGY